MSTLQSRVSTQSPAYVANRAAMREIVDTFKKRLLEAQHGGGSAAAAKHRARGKMLARERIQAVIDPGTGFLEFSGLAAFEVYDGDAPGAGIVTGLGVIEGRGDVVAREAIAEAPVELRGVFRRGGGETCGELRDGRIGELLPRMLLGESRGRQSERKGD